MSSLFLHVFFFFFFSFLSEMNYVGQRTIDFPFFKNILHILFKQHLDKESKPHYTCDRGSYYAGKPRHQLCSVFA